MLSPITPEFWKPFFPFLRTLATIVFFGILFTWILNRVHRMLIKRVTSKKNLTNVNIFHRIMKYVLFLVLILFGISSYFGSLAGFGLSLGLFTAGIGWAMQKPITGLAAWLMLVIRRPFQMGDRIIVGDVTGDVKDITLTHIYLDEVGGLVPSEERSGRIVMLPNAIIFDSKIINYTKNHDFVLDQVTVEITYESDLRRAVMLVEKAAKKVLGKLTEAAGQGPVVRSEFDASGINLHVRYFAPATELQAYSSSITTEIFSSFRSAKDVDIAYPHTEIVYHGKKE